MVYQFKTMDDETFVLDIVNMRWGRASSILSAPSVVAATDKENNLARYVFSEEGDLAAMGGGHYGLVGRTPKTTGPGAGLSAIGILAIPYEDTLVLTIKANVPLKPDSFTSGPIKNVKYHIAQDVQVAQ